MTDTDIETYLSSLDQHLEKEANELGKFVLLHGAYDEVVGVEALEMVYKEAIISAFTNQSVSDLINIRSLETVRISTMQSLYIDMLAKAIGYQVRYYDALKTYYLYSVEDFPLQVKDQPLTTEAIKIILSEAFEADCGHHCLDPTSDRARDLKHAVPDYLVKSLKHYAEILRGARPTVGDVAITLQSYGYTLSHIVQPLTHRKLLKGMKS